MIEEALKVGISFEDLHGILSQEENLTIHPPEDEEMEVEEEKEEPQEPQK